jgi:hypothetical protein
VAECGDGSCDPGEETTCSADCSLGLCDGVCDIIDAFLCPADCEVCGDGSCRGAETRSSCAADCPVGCGDGTCGGGETADSCPYDCSTCGDGICGGSEILECPTDCLGF